MVQKPQRPMLARIHVWVLRLAMLFPAIILAGTAMPRLVSGFALAMALPVPYLIDANEHLPTTAYKAARDALAYGSTFDGQMKIWEAQAAYLAGSRSEDVQPILASALDRAPSSAQGWTLLAEIEASRDPERAASALGLALQLAPFDYWLGPRRVSVGSGLWNVLNVEQRDSLLRQVRLLWSEPQLRAALEAAFATQQGGALAARAFADEPDVLRELNRRVTRDKLRNFVAP